jgi:hypothetical protein
MAKEELNHRREEMDANSIRWFELLKTQHTNLHHLLYKFPRKGNRTIIKNEIANIISSLSQILANL